MPAPIVGPVALLLYNELSPLGFADEATDWSLLHWCESWGQLLDELDYIVHTGPTGKVGWAALVDPDAATENTIDYVGQLIGLSFPVGTTMVQKQNKIKDGGNLYRATPKALAGEIQSYPWMIGSETIYLYERAYSAYHHLLKLASGDVSGTFSLNQNFEDGATDGWINDAFVFFSNTGAQFHSGSKSMAISFPSTFGIGIHKEVVAEMEIGDQFTMEIWVKVNTTVLSGDLILQYGNVAEGDGANTYIAQDATDGWVRYELPYTAANAGAVQIAFFNNSGSALDIGVDDLTVTSKVFPEGVEEELRQAVDLQKPMGHLIDTAIFAPYEWNWFTLGATRYQRDIAGFMQEIPSPYGTWGDVLDYFRSWGFFYDNRLEWLSLNNDFQFGNLDNWTTAGSVAATAFANSEAWQETQGWVARFISPNPSQISTLSNDIMEIDPTKSYRVKGRKKIVSKSGASSRTYILIRWLDAANAQQATTAISDATGVNGVGTYTIDQVVTVPAGLGIVKAQYQFVCETSSGIGSNITAYVDDASFKFEPEA